MSVPSTKTVSNYDVNPSATEYTYDFKLRTADTLKVIYTDIEGIEHVLVKDIDYSVSDIGLASGHITLVEALPSGRLSLQRVEEYNTDVDIKEGSRFPATAIRAITDQNTMLIQQNKSQIDRSIQASMTEDSASLIIPNLEERRNSFLGFDNDGAFKAEAGITPDKYFGDYNYRENDIIQYLGKFFISKVNDNLGHEPSPEGETAYWRIFSTEAGAQVDGVLGETIVANKLVYFHTDGKLYIGDNDNILKAILAGFLVKGGDADDNRLVQSAGVLDGFTGLSVGTQYYLGSDGNLITKGAIEYSEYVISVGVAISSTKINVAIRLPEANRSYDNGLEIGAFVEFATYKDRSAQGLFPFDYDNAVSQANYSILFAEIGHKWNAAHKAVGDTDLSTSTTLFYPTPPPSFYGRTATPDSLEISILNVSAVDNDITLTAADYNKFRRMKFNTDSYNGVPVCFKKDSPGLSLNTIYFIRFVNDATYKIKVYSSELDAINDSACESLTPTSSFFLTQEGIVFDDAMQRHNHKFRYKSITFDGASSSADNIGSDPTGTKTNRVAEPITDGINGEPRTSNETRPKTVLMYKYVKAEYVTTAGKPVSALRYDTGWVANSDWTDMSKVITHNLNTALNLLHVHFYISSTGDDSNVREYIQNTSISSANYGYGWTSTDKDSIIIQTGENGFLGLDSAGKTFSINTQAWYYRVVIIKPNLISTVFDTTYMSTEYDIATANQTITLPELTGVLQTREHSWINGDGTAKLQFSVPDNTGTYTTSEYEGEGEGHIKFEAVNGVSGLKWKVVEYEDDVSAVVNTWKNVVKGINGKYTTGYFRIYEDDLAETSFWIRLDYLMKTAGDACICSGIVNASSTSYYPARIAKNPGGEFAFETATVSSRNTRYIKSDGSGSWVDTNNTVLTFNVSYVSWK